MVIDNKGRIFGKISIIDILFILIIAFAGVFTLNKLGFISPKEILSIGGNKAEIVFFQEEINNFSANNVHVGDIASEALTNVNFGQVTDVALGESISWAPDVNGNQVVRSSREGYSSIYITMEVNATVGPNGITIGGSTFYIGETITLRAGNSIFYGKIYGANKI